MIKPVSYYYAKKGDVTLEKCELCGKNLTMNKIDKKECKSWFSCPEFIAGNKDHTSMIIPLHRTGESESIPPITADMLEGLNKSQVIDVCRKNGYEMTVQQPEFFRIGFAAQALSAGIKKNQFIRCTDLVNHRNKKQVFIIDIYDGWHSPLSDNKIIVSKLFVDDNYVRDLK